MLTPEQVFRRGRNHYAGFLRSLCTGARFFPLTVFGAGMAKPGDFAADRAAIDQLQGQSKAQTGYGYEITWTERKFRRWGMQKIPRTVFFSTEQDYVRALGKQAEVRQFRADYELICAQCPELQAWALEKPLEVVAYAGRWQKLLGVCAYLRENPHPGCYVRELPVPVETKFVERHAGILGQLLPIAAPVSVTSETTRFESKFGFRCKQPLVRIRFLDAHIASRCGFPIDDVAIPLDGFCGLPLGGVVIIIVENEMTFLTLPSLAATAAVFGAGDAAAVLIGVEWLSKCPIIYWGDLDSHGFETLSGLRMQFPSVTSLMMDERTYLDHQDFAVEAAQTRCQGHLSLTSVEQKLYDLLVKTGKLLEQEHIPNRYSQPLLQCAVSALAANGDTQQLEHQAPAP